MNKEELLEIKDEIEQAQKKVSQLQGRKEYLMKQLWEEWKCKDIEQGQKKLNQIKKDIEDLDEKIRKGTQKVEVKYNEITDKIPEQE